MFGSTKSSRLPSDSPPDVRLNPLSSTSVWRTPLARPDWDPRSHYQDDNVARSYDRQRFSSLPGRVFNELERRAVLRAFEGTGEDSIILDAPCGTGRLSEPLLAKGYSVIGLDVSAQMIAVAQQRLQRFGKRFTPIVADLADLPTLDLHPDASLCARLLMHLPLEEQVASLRLMSATTRGRVVFTQSLVTPWLRARRFAKRLLRHQSPVRHPLTRAHLQKVSLLTELTITRKIAVAPLVSEAYVFVAE